MSELTKECDALIAQSHMKQIDLQTQYFEVSKQLKESQSQSSCISEALRNEQSVVERQETQLKRQIEKIQSLSIQNTDQKEIIEKLENDCKDLNDALISEGHEIEQFKQQTCQLLGQITDISQTLNKQRSENTEIKTTFQSEIKQAKRDREMTGIVLSYQFRTKTNENSEQNNGPGE